ncbi:MAG TPA: hypothetical protein VNH11_32615 [Pirellulales bacterium]|nr:hypothetical protein [Pirellulales bacterium]
MDGTLLDLALSDECRDFPAQWEPVPRVALLPARASRSVQPALKVLKDRTAQFGGTASRRAGMPCTGLAAHLVGRGAIRPVPRKRDKNACGQDGIGRDFNKTRIGESSGPP